jgi:hypothetical protein
MSFYDMLLEKNLNGVGSDSIYNYSTTEKQVGTWIDGKPIYQKTLTGSFTVQSDARYYQTIEDITSLNVDALIGYDGYILDGTVYKPMNIADKYSASITYDINTKLLCVVITNWPTSAQKSYAITIRYTKSTDTPA